MPDSSPSAPASSGTAVSLPILSDGGDRSSAPRIKRSRAARWRAIVLIAVHVIIVAHLIKWLVRGGGTLSPVEPSESMEFVKNGVVNAGLVFFALALLSTLVFGRWFCGWGCHVVALQDLCAAMLKRIGIRPKPFRSRLLIYVPFILAMYMFVWPAIYRWGIVPISQQLAFVPDLAAPPWPGISVALVREDFWSTFPGVLVAIPFLLVCGFACVYFLGAKGFCTYGCPYGGFFAPLDQFARGRIRVNDDCEHCGHCTAVCSSNVRVHEEVAAYGMVVDPGCMKCMDCVSVCPNDALSYGFGCSASSAMAKPRDPSAVRAKQYDLSWPEEIAFAGVFLGTFLATRGAYGLIPMLMAAGLAGCVTFIAWKAWRVIRRPNASFHRWRLRFHGRFTGAGLGYLAVTAGLVALVLHSGLVQVIHRQAGSADGAVTIPRSLVFAASPRRLDPEMAASADVALAGYRRMQPFWEGGIGLTWWPGTHVRMAWLEACRHDFAAAEALMRRHLELFGHSDAVATDVMILKSLQLDDAGAIEWATAYLREHPSATGTATRLFRMLEAEQRTGEAIALMDSLIADLGPESGDRRHRRKAARLGLLRVLSLALVSAGELERGIAVIERTLELDDSSWGGWLELTRARALAGRGEQVAESGERAWALRPTADVATAIAASLERVGRILEAGAWRSRAAEAQSRAQAEAEAAGAVAGPTAG